MRVNARTPSTPAPKTHGGATASRMPPTAELRRAVMSCLLWEDQFYETGVLIAERINDIGRPRKQEAK